MSYQPQEPSNLRATEQCETNCRCHSRWPDVSVPSVWEEEKEETEDAEEIIDNEFETSSEGKEGE